jgi:hypothetical protein
MGKQWASRFSPKRGVRGSFDIATLERRLLMCVEHLLQQGHLPEGLGTFAAQLDVPLGSDATFTGTTSVVAAAPLAAVPALSSNPSAAAKLFLDFDGDTSARWGEYTPGTTPAYGQDADFTSFSAAEASAIQEIWSRLAEKFSPFNIDVTTVDPGNLTNHQTARVVFGGAGSWLGTSAGGVAYVGGFNNSAPNTSWVFTQNLGNGYAPYAAEAAAHESGHLFGLEHQAQWSGSTLVSEYSPGTSTTAPIMGSSYSSPRGLWWKGTPSTSPTYSQDDMAIIAGPANRFGYRADDFGGSIGAAAPLALSNNAFRTSGVVERTTDWDFFKFETGAGNVSFDAATIGAGATLDLQLGLFDGAGTQLALASTASLGEKLSTSVAAGTYYLGVASRGNYGDVGQYTLSGAVAPVATTTTNTRTGTVSRRREVDIFSSAPITGATTTTTTTTSIRSDARVVRPRTAGAAAARAFDFGVRDRVAL